MGTATLRTDTVPRCYTPEELSSISDRYGFQIVGDSEDDLFSLVINRVADLAAGPPEWGEQVVSLTELRLDLTSLLVKALERSGATVPRWPTFHEDMDRAAGWIVLSALNHLGDCGLALVAIPRPAKPLAECWL